MKATKQEENGEHSGTHEHKHHKRIAGKHRRKTKKHDGKIKLSPELIDSKKARYINLKVNVHVLYGENKSRNIKLNLRLQITEKVYQQCLKNFIKTVKLFVRIRVNGNQQLVRTAARSIKDFKQET